MDFSLSEQQLVRRCAHGERSAQQALYEAHCEAMLLVCLRYLPDGGEAQEAMMDGFSKCFGAIGTFEYRGPGSFSTWLKRIVVNQCLMRLRRPVLITGVLDDGHDPPDDPKLFEALGAKEIMQLIQALPDGYRTVFNLFCFEDMSHREIAEHLGISANTSKSQLAKARASLQQSITALFKHP